MPNLTTKEFVDYFWMKFDEISNLDRPKPGLNIEYEQLLLSVLDISKEILLELDNAKAPTIAKSELPLLAMVSEIQSVAPKAVLNIAKESKSIEKALTILKNYPAEKRHVLKENFLPRDQ